MAHLSSKHKIQIIVSMAFPYFASLLGRLSYQEGVFFRLITVNESSLSEIGREILLVETRETSLSFISGEKL